MKEIFNQYVSQLILITFGFTPRIRIEIPSPDLILIFLDGSEDERKQMMGYKSQTLSALKRLLVCFSRKHDMFFQLYIEFPNESYQPQISRETYPRIY